MVNRGPSPYDGVRRRVPLRRAFPGVAWRIGVSIATLCRSLRFAIGRSQVEFQALMPSSDGPWVMTFHGELARFSREHVQALSYQGMRVPI